MTHAARPFLYSTNPGHFHLPLCVRRSVVGLTVRMALEFEWEASKASSNAAKHGVTFDEALTAFRDTRASIFDELDHSADEHRELLIGHSERGRLIVVSFTERAGRI